MNKLYFALLTLCFLCSCELGRAASFADRYNVETIGMSDGLEHDFVDDLMKDSNGFMWIAMQGGGLSRYDGNVFTNYGRNTVPVQLKSNFVSQVIEDNYKRLWAISDAGVDIIDLNLMQKSPLEETPCLQNLMGKPIDYIEKDARGKLWIYATDTLHCISLGTDGGVERCLDLALGYEDGVHIAFKDADCNGSVWTAIEGRICRIEVSGDGGQLVVKPVSETLVFNPQQSFLSFQPRGDEVWMASDGGLVRYNKTHDSKKVYVNVPGNTHSLLQNYVTDVLVTDENCLVVSSFIGLNVYNPLTDGFERIGNTQRPNDVLTGKYINCLYANQGTIWIGCENYGIVKFSPKRLQINRYSHSTLASSLSPNPVNAIYYDPSQTLWVGTVEGGLNRKLPGTNTFDHYTVESGALSHNSVSAITTDGAGRLWVGTWGKGVNVLDRQHPDRRLMLISDASTQNRYMLDFVGFLCYDSINNVMWIGANQGVYVYDCATDSLYAPLPQVNFLGSLGAALDAQGHLWMGSKFGLYDVDVTTLKSGHLDYRIVDDSKPGSLDHALSRITYVHLGADGTLWIASYGCGLFKREVDDRGQERFVNYNIANGLINNNVRGIAEDPLGNLWVSTNNGLSCFRHKQYWENYGQADGIGNAKFYWNAAATSPQGHVLMGSVDGLLEIVPEVTHVDQPRGTLKFTHLYVADEEVFAPSEMLDADISVATKVRIHEKDRSFTLSFADLDYSSRNGAYAYSYKLQGFDTDWIRVRNGQKMLTYTNLAPGDYRLLVRLDDGSDVEQKPMVGLDIVIEPYFYKTFWFRLLLLSLLAGGLWLAVWWRVRSLLQQRRALHHEVLLRTSELQEQKKLLEAKTIELKQLMGERLSFYTNITHEFRTPITLIMGPIQRVLRMTSDVRIGEQLHIVERNSRYLLQLVNQLMDFRKLESGKYDIVKTRGNFEKFVGEILSGFAAYAADRGIALTAYWHLSVKEFDYDEDALQKVLTNLLSNAIKFTPDGGAVRLYAAMLPPQSPEQTLGERNLYLAVSDTGIGISEEEQQKVFDRFYQSKNQIRFPLFGTSGSGIGLYLSREMVEMHGGHIWVKNKAVKGCCFRIVLPVTGVTEGEASTSIDAVRKMQPSPLMEADASTQEPETHPDKRTLLVVEDNEDMRLYIRSILEPNYHVLEAENGAASLAVLAEEGVDLILSDLMMPVMDGMELSRNVKANFATSHIPIVMLTAKTSQQSKVDSYKIGVDEFLVKPFDEDELKAVIARIFMNLDRYKMLFSQHYQVEQIEIAHDSSDKKFVDHVMEVLKKNYKNSYFDVGDFCEEMGVSKTLLNNKLQTLMGQSALQLLRGYRLSLAHDMLVQNKETHSMSIAEIAYEVGFNDPKYFTRCFTKQYNCPPSAV